VIAAIAVFPPRSQPTSCADEGIGMRDGSAPGLIGKI
jgi:hypothetical protein